MENSKELDELELELRSIKRNNTIAIVLSVLACLVNVANWIYFIMSRMG